MENVFLQEFDQYIGQTVTVTKTTSERQIGEVTFDSSTYDIPSTDSVMNSIESAAKLKGMDLRVWLPNTVGSCEYRFDRLNVSIKESNGKYVVDSFRIG